MPDSITPKEIDREGIRLLLRRGGSLVEVSPREEYERLHLPGAVSIPLSMFSRRTADKLAWDKPVIVYAKDCLDDRSGRAAWRLASLGFTQVYRYVEGKAGWLANGLPAEGAAAEAETIADLADLDVPTCKTNEKVGDVKARVTPEGWNVCVVINDQLVVLGLLRPSDLEKADPTWPAEETMDRDPATLRLDVRPEEARKILQEKRLEQVLVTFPDGKLFGLLKLEDLLSG